MNSKRPLVVLFCVRFLLAQIVSVVQADEPSLTAGGSSDDRAPVERLTLHPAAEARPALGYQLLPSLLERKSGNAAVIYNKAGMRFTGEKFDELQQKLSDWAEMPLDKLPRDEIREALGRWDTVLFDLRRAARRTDIDWELALGEQEFFSILLNDAQKTRDFARLLIAQARLQIAEGKFNEAIETLQTTFAMARHVGSGPTLINCLVGFAISQMAAAQLRDMAQQPGAPNMYWALASLPQPLVDMRPAIESEMNSLYLTYPALAELRKGDHSPAYWDAFIERLVEDLGKWSGSNEPAWQGRLAVTAFAIKGYPMAKEYLVSQGRTPTEVEAMPVAQVVALYTMQVYDELRDEIFKWFFVPYPVARQGVQRAEELLKQSRHREVVPVAQLLLPAIANVRLAEARAWRTIAMLQVVEALRMHAAAHDNQLPRSLAEITQVPVPRDPVTGGVFTYNLNGDVAVLDAPLPAGLSPRTNGSRFEIRIAAPQR